MDKRRFILEIAQGKNPQPCKFQIYEVVEGKRILKEEFDSDIPLEIEVISRREDVCGKA